MPKVLRNKILLVISIISLVFLLLDYYGILRYLKVHLLSPGYYTGRYLKRSKAGKERVVVAFPLSNTGRIRPFVNSILDQTVRVDEIVAVARYGTRVDPDLEKVLSIAGYSTPYGECTCLLYSLFREPEADTILILANPDVVYRADLVQDMIETSRKNPENILFSDVSKNAVLVKPAFFETGHVDTARAMSDLTRALKEAKCKGCMLVEYSSGNYGSL